MTLDSLSQDQQIGPKPYKLFQLPSPSQPHPPKKSGPYPGTWKCYLIWKKGFAEVIK